MYIASCTITHRYDKSVNTLVYLRLEHNGVSLSLCHCQNPSNSDSEESELNSAAASDSGKVVTLLGS